MGFIFWSSSTLALCPSMALMKWKAPIRFPWSVMATAGIPSAEAASTNWLMREVACSTENWVWLCKCTKGASASAAFTSILGPAPLGLTFFFLSFSEACLRLRWSKPTREKGRVRAVIPWVNSAWLGNVLGWRASRRSSSKKAREVASTSAVALWASSNRSPNRKW